MHFKELISSKATIAAITVGVAGILVVLYAWQLPPFTSSVQSTNNAYIKGQVTLIAPQLAGYVVDVPHTDYEPVRKGDLLIKLDDRIYAQQLAQAEATLAVQQNNLDNYAQNHAAKQASIDLANAQLTAAQAGLKKAQADAERSDSLVSQGLSAQSSADQVQAAFSQAQASVEQAQANVAIAEQALALVEAGKPALQSAVDGAKAGVAVAKINLANTAIVAPVDGRLGEVTARVGQYVSVGSQLTSVTPARTWVIANFKETQMEHIHVGQAIALTVDALGHAPMTGHITEISPAAGSEFSVLKPDNATGNFTKIAQRIPVRIEIDPDQDQAEALLPGMSVEVSVDTAEDATKAVDVAQLN